MGRTCRTHRRDDKYNILVGKPEDHTEDIGVDERIILEWILGK